MFRHQHLHRMCIITETRVIRCIIIVMIGITNTVWTLTSDVIFGETKLCCDLSVTVAVVIDNISIRLFWYSAAKICAVYFNCSLFYHYYIASNTSTKRFGLIHLLEKHQKKFTKRQNIIYQNIDIDIVHEAKTDIDKL